MLKTFASFCLCIIFYTAGYAQAKNSDTTRFNKILFAPQPNFAINHVPAVVPQNFSVKNLPFFCDKEFKLEKVTKIPFRFRLGSVAYCDKMEGKNN